MNKAVIFDLDGTLLNTLQDLADSVNYSLNKHGYPLRSIEDVRRFVGNGVAKLIDRCIPEKSDEERSRVLADFLTHYRQNLTNKTAPYDGITELLRKLKQEGYGIAIVSNKFDAAVKGLSKMYFDGLVDEAIGESDGVRKKPAPDSVIMALKKLGCERDNAVYVGDSDVDVQTAKNSLLSCIGVTWGFRDRDVLTTAGAQKIADNADELYELIKTTV